MRGVLDVLLDASVRIAVAAGLVALVLYCARVRASALRHRVWFAVVCAMLLMPVLPRVTQRVSPPVVLPAVLPVHLADPEPAAPEALTRTKPELPVRLEVTAGANRVAAAPFPWASLLVGVYAGAAILFLARVCLGWRFARALMRSARPASIDGITIYESGRVVSPLTVGLLRPRILFPQGWEAWPEQKRRAVLAHELAHVRRRDTAVNFLAHLNRCVFWFHPLAWWLQGQLTLAAEEACDDAGVRAVGARRDYAEVLMEIAQSARRGRHAALQGMGVDGTGVLTHRIDRLLRRDSNDSVPVYRRAMVFGACAAAIFIAAACREKQAAPLKADPEYARQVERSIAGNRVLQEISRMSAADAEALDAAVRKNPEDTDARNKLISFYQARGRAVLGDEKATQGFWRLQLWCIEHHPEDSCSVSAPPLFDQASYEKGTKLWDAALRSPGVGAREQTNAVHYFTRSDPKRAETIANGAAVDAKTRARLIGGIYSIALSQAPQSAYATEVRKRLDVSKDAALLSAVGFGLSMQQSPDSARSILGHQYLDRAIALDPASVDRKQLAMVTSNQQRAGEMRAMIQAVGQEFNDAQYQKVSALPAADRALYLPTLAQQAYWRGATLNDSNHDSAAAHKMWDLGRRYGNDALTVEEQFRSDPNYANRVFEAYGALAMIAYRADSDGKAARRYLHAAAIQPTNQDRWFPTSLKLLTLMLRYGNAEDRAAVIEFLELQSKRPHSNGVNLEQSAQKLRKGVMPTWYQVEVTQFPDRAK